MLDGGTSQVCFVFWISPRAVGAEGFFFPYAMGLGSLEVQMTELKYLYGVFPSQQGERSGEGVSLGNCYKNPASEIIYYALEYICMYFKGLVCEIW